MQKLFALKIFISIVIKYMNKMKLLTQYHGGKHSFKALKPPVKTMQWKCI